MSTRNRLIIPGEIVKVDQTSHTVGTPGTLDPVTGFPVPGKTTSMKGPWYVRFKHASGQLSFVTGDDKPDLQLGPCSLILEQ